MYRFGHQNDYKSLSLNAIQACIDPNREIYPDWVYPEAENIRCFLPHHHETLEVLHVKEGILHTQLDGKTEVLRAGEFMLASPYMSHSGDCFKKDGMMRFHCIQIELGFLIPPTQCPLRESLRSILNGTRSFPDTVRFDHPARPEMEEKFERLYNLISEDAFNPMHDCRRMAAAYALLDVLMNHLLASESACRVSRDLHFIRSVIRWLEAHFREKITTHDISDALCYNLNHFCRLFRYNFGTSFSRYLCKYRIQYAVEFYRSSSLPVGEIAAAVGFTDYRYFAQAFHREMGISPSAFFLN